MPEVVESTAAEIDFTPLLEELTKITDTNLVLISLLAFLSALALLLLFSGGWGNG